MYNCYRSCWITDLVLPTHTFGEAIIKTSKIHNLFIPYSNNIYILVCWNPLEIGDKTYLKNCLFNNNK